jgi:hypothetical protein
LFPHLADRPHGVGGPSARSPAVGYSSCSSRVLVSLCFDPSSWVFSIGISLPDCPPGVAGLSARDGLSVGWPRTVRISRFRTCCSDSNFGPSAGVAKTVRQSIVDCPPGHCGPSAWAFAELLSPLLLEFRFRLGLFGVCS